MIKGSIWSTTSWPRPTFAHVTTSFLLYFSDNISINIISLVFWASPHKAHIHRLINMLIWYSETFEKEIVRTIFSYIAELIVSTHNNISIIFHWDYFNSIYLGYFIHYWISKCLSYRFLSCCQYKKQQKPKFIL